MSVEPSDVFVSFKALVSETTFRKRYDMIESANRGTTKPQRGRVARNVTVSEVELALVGVHNRCL